MNKMLIILWPLLTIPGVLFVVLFDQGNGLDSPGFWLIPVGVLGVVVTSIRNGNAQRLKPLGSVWLLAFISILGLRYGWFTEGFDGFIWILPAAGFTFAGIILLFYEAFRNIKR